MERDPMFSKFLQACLQHEGVKPPRRPPRSPNLNAHLESFFGSLKSECVQKMVLFGKSATREVIWSYIVHYHTERNHQGLSNELILSLEQLPNMDGKIKTSEHLRGMFRSYRRMASLVRHSLVAHRLSL
jgi:hypothetical protein